MSSSASSRPGLGPFRYFVVVLAIAAYWPSFTAEFHFDDHALLTDPAVVGRSGPLELLGLERTRPLTYLTFWVNYQLGGADPLGYHVFNVVLLAALAWFAAGLFEKLAAPDPARWALAFLILHPLQTEATAYVYGRAVLLAALLCVLCWRSWLQGRYWAACGWFLAAMMAKEEAAAFPVFLAGWEWFVQRRRPPMEPIAAMLAIVAAAGIRLVYAAQTIGDAGALVGLEEITPWSYFMTQGRVVFLYVRLAVLPIGLNFDRDVLLSSGLDPSDLVAWLTIGAIVAAAAAHVRRVPALYSLVGGFILLIPTSSFAPLADLAADRRMSLPLLSFSLAAGALLARRGGDRFQKVGPWALALLLAGGTFDRCLDWRTEETLWRDTVAKSPAKARPKLHLARTLERGGGATRVERLALLEQARALEPRNPDVLTEIGVFQMREGSPQQALAAFEAAEKLSPQDAQATANVGSALFLLERQAEAASTFQQALETDPCNFDARNNLLLMVRRMGDQHEAERLATPPAGCRFSVEQRAAFEGVP